MLSRIRVSVAAAVLGPWYDTQGVAMGRCAQAALWAGWMNMFRVDGWELLDFSVLSAREILPPATPAAPP